MARLIECMVVVLFASLSVLAAETKPAETKPAETKPVTGKAEAAVDRTPDKYKKAEGERVWFTAEYFGAMTKDSPYPDFPLVTKGDPAFLTSGILGEPGTTVVFNRQGEDFGIQHGFKLTAGGWVTEDRKFGVELSGFLQPQVKEKTSIAMDANNYLCVPYFDTPFGVENCLFYTPSSIQPGNSATIAITNKQQFWGIGAMGLMNLHRGDSIDLDLKFGIRHLNLGDEFGFAQSETTTAFVPFADTLLLAGGSLSAVDRFKARNNFIGADVGVRIGFHYGRFRAELQPKIALGGTMQSVDISGRSTALDAATGAFLVANGGFWALDTNIGKHERTRFTVVPEMNVKVGVEICKNLDFQAGYGVTYWSDVVRAGKHVNRSINVDKVALQGYGPLSTITPAVPTFKFKSSDFWAHGVTAGFKVKF